MDSGGHDVLSISSETDKAADVAAGEPSPDSTESSSGRRGRERRLTNAVTSEGCGISTAGSVRVLRARRGEAGRTGDFSDAACTNRTVILLSGRGRPAETRTKNTPVLQPAVKTFTANKASRRTLRPQLSKSRKGKPATRASCTTPAATCKPEAQTEASSYGEDPEAVKGSDDNVADPDVALVEDPFSRDDSSYFICKPDTKAGKSRRRTMLQRKEVKKEESEKDGEENGIKKEESNERVVQSKDGVGNKTEPTRKRGRQDDKLPRQPKRRKKPPVQYVRCEMEGCGTVLAHPRYLQHHIKYQHLLKKKYVCDHPSCGRLFRLQKQLLRHAKHHTDQRDYICEYCARSFKSSHNLSVHRMIHTGQKPIQCEICGFTCRQKASLNWHMKKHDAEASYQFSCSICGKRFEKKDCVVAHKAKSHPEVLIAEALAANGGSVISSATPSVQTAPVITQPERPSFSQESQKSQEVASDMLTPLQQVVLPLSPLTQPDVSQDDFLQLPTHHLVQVTHQPSPTLLHLTTASPTHLSSPRNPQLIQPAALPAGTTNSMTPADSQSALLTLSSVTPLSSVTSPAPQQAVHWGREANEDAQIPGEGELWNRVVVGECHQDVGEVMWERNAKRRKENESIVWDREGETQILIHCAEAHGDSLI